MSRLRWVDWLAFIIVGFIIAFIFISINGFINKGIELFSVYSPLVFPTLVGVSLLVFWLLTIILDLRKGIESTDEESGELAQDIVLAIVYVIVILIYALIIKKLGFMAGSILFLIIGMIYMNYDEGKLFIRIRNATIVSCITVPLLYYIFYEVFRVMLP